jgi:glycosyltransferase involved in cell wall biosynthesis
VTDKPRVLFVGRGRLTLPLAPWLAKKWDALDEVFDWRVLNAGSGSGDPRFRLLPDGARAFYLGLPRAVARELADFHPDAVVAGDSFVGAGVLAGRRLARGKAKIIVEVHGDPATFTRLYGSSSRKLLAQVADSVSRTALRRADATRAVSAFTAAIVERARGLPPTATFTAYSDLAAFDDPPLVPVPAEPRVVFVGALERYKNIDGLADAWRLVAAELPEAGLIIVGRGSRRAVVDRLVAEFPGRVEHYPELAPSEVSTQIDRGRALVLPSWPEGLGRVVIEAFARGRAVIATDAGGIPDIVTDDLDGILLPPASTPALAAALLRILGDHALAERLGAAARTSYGAWHQTPEEFARAYRALVDRVLAGAR